MGRVARSVAAISTKVQRQSVFAICNCIVQITDAPARSEFTVCSAERGCKLFVARCFRAEFNEGARQA
jgi:hypothetical protein